MNVLTKQQNYGLWRNGSFGNKLRAWRTIDEWRRSGYYGLVALRALLPVGGGPCRYNLTSIGVMLALADWRKIGFPIESIMINEMAPPCEILQGEYLNAVREDGNWGHFLHSRIRAPMREALKTECATSHGLRSSLLIQQAMTNASWEDWQELLLQYPDHVLEVSIFDRCLGDIPGRNALVWEIRKY